MNISKLCSLLGIQHWDESKKEVTITMVALKKLIIKAYAENQGLTFSTWAMLELRKIMNKGQKV